MNEVEKIKRNDIRLFVCCDVGVIRPNLCCICTFERKCQCAQCCSADVQVYDSSFFFVFTCLVVTSLLSLISVLIRCRGQTNLGAHPVYCLPQ